MTKKKNVETKIVVDAEKNVSANPPIFINNGLNIGGEEKNEEKGDSNGNGSAMDISTRNLYK